MSSYEQVNKNTDNAMVADVSIDLPPECDVIFFNDDYTTMEFVVDVLVSVFNKPRPTAELLMTEVHENGSAVVGRYTYDIAYSRANLARSLAKKNNFPLRVEVE
ncbi:MAG: ATP-dependent Clp protease adaptor ClpS [Treponema sp.]|nr:ATP-dependent Clp protease adaptor ClpS [Treponema sp.]